MTELLTICLVVLVPLALLDTYRMRRMYQLKFTTLKIRFLFWKLNKAMKTK